jgi:hypothetical protein
VRRLFKGAANMDAVRIRKLSERYEGVFAALMVALAAIVGTVTKFFEVLREPWDWGWAQWIVASLLLVVAVVLVRRSLRGHASRLLDPNALNLDPQSPDQLIGRAEDLQKFLKALVNPLVFLISESGCGKTALLRAGVEQHPDFTNRYLPIYILICRPWTGKTGRCANCATGSPARFRRTTLPAAA